jgi:ParB family protein of integrating conjugative element (PFGI_1 class)
MAETRKDSVAEKIQAPAFARTQPEVSRLSDPIADTPMIVTLDELRTYDSDPRMTRNPKYDELKLSIRERGLDAPPPITRRPGESMFIIANGGNTRLSILRELWTETKDERFYRIRCLFRPYPERGEVVLLTGHLAENDLHGALTFIERALAVEKARLLYEAAADGASLTQAELAKRLSADGYPITQSQISRMQDTVRHLLPAIPSALYGGLGRDQIERITALRKAAARVHGQHATSEQIPVDFGELFQGVLAQFDGPPESFNIQRVRDELIGQLSSVLHIEYDSLAIEIVDAETRSAPPSREKTFHVKPSGLPQNTADTETRIHPSSSADVSPTTPPPLDSTSTVTTPNERAVGATSGAERVPAQGERTPPESRGPSAADTDRVRANIVTPPATTDRVEAIRRLVADATGTPLADFKSNVLHSVPVAAGGLHPISDVWYIEPNLDTLGRLRIHAAQLAVEIADEAGAPRLIEAVEDGIGFTCASLTAPGADSLRSRTALMFLAAISGRFLQRPGRSAVADVRIAEYLGALLMGERPGHRLRELRFSDASVVKLFRLIRLGRRILELQANGDRPSDETATLL